MIYFDSSYVVRLYFGDPGFEAVRDLAGRHTISCAQHGRAEVSAALHRKVREGAITPKAYRIVLEEFAREMAAGAFVWLPLSENVFDRVHRAFATLPPKVFLRSADTMHLAAAAENGFREIYSNDKNLIAAGANFGITGIDILA